MFKEKVAIIDIGSNSIRLVIYGIDEEYNFVELQNVKTPARLSENIQMINEQAILDQTGIDKLISALDSFKYVIESYQADTVIPKATAAIRQSANQASIIEQVEQATGIRIQLVSEQEEALYGLYAVLHSTTIEDAVTIDIGGGSCEITLYEKKELKHYKSFPFGAVSLRKDFFTDKAHNDPEAMEAVRKFVRKQFKAFPWIKKAKLPIIAIGGSARNVANVHQRLVHYPLAGIHGYGMTDDAIDMTLQTFVTTEASKLGDIDGLSSDRQDIIIPATIVFQELYNVVKASFLAISTQGLREGIVLKYINEKYNTPIDMSLIRARTIRGIGHLFPVDTSRNYLRINYALSLYQQLCELNLLPYSYEYHEEIEFAAYLYHFGSFIDVEADSQHTFYLLSNMNLSGYSHRKRLRLALLSSYRNRSLQNQYLEIFPGWFTEEEQLLLQKLGGILKFSQALNDSQTDPIDSLELVALDDGNYRLDIYHHKPIIAEKYRAQRHLKHLERALDGQLSLNFIAINQPA
ncbi:Ppx/GppA family phosphatase [Fundicoccus culcitae]|uniref:Ppx/GppA family phosphatase n=1 Tax=Fundicoccus culcitae TaxID=2969821 RepID=A0ABY5P2J4_9LACT|nr:Ppx/GppA family phosphatase [Fundicoccus culcitae]UUX32821.1 Ppx/GppA family phosphatase [Fundicoccus culcitae]